MTTSDPMRATPGALRNYFERALLGLAILLVGWFDVWTLESTGHVWNFGAEQNDYYNLLIDGWLDGRLHMKVDAPEALLKLRDPYDPNQRPPGVGLHDASFYRGKYYLYFGAAPLVLLMLPFRVVTGIDLPVAFATLVFVYGGFLASAGVWLAVRRRYFAESRTSVAVLGVLALGIASLAPVLLRRPQMWELPIAAGYCFAMLALGCVWRSLHAERRRDCWLCGASLALGLAIASRPPYLFATPLLLMPVIARWRQERGFPWRALIGVAAPLALIGALMAVHNYLRFENPLEFGQAYQLTYFDERSNAHFSLRYVAFNGWRYFFSTAQWSPYFPFITPAELPAKPPGFSGHDDVYGVLTNLPLAWFALFAPLALINRVSLERARLRAWLSAAGALFLVMAGLLLCFFGSLARYEVDFAPTLMLLACVGVLAIERLCAGATAALRSGARAAWSVATIFSVGFAVLFTLQYDGQLQRHNPDKAASVARVLNWVPYAFERVVGAKHGGVDLEISLRPQPAGDEALLTIGNSPNLDRVLVRHVDPAHVQIVIAPANMPEIASRAVALDFTRAHTLRVELGSLLPPETHPLFRGRDAAELAELTRQVRIGLDGETLIDERRELASGARPLRTGSAVTSLRRVAAAPAARPQSFVRLRVSLPPTITTQREPLIAFREASGSGAGGVIYVHYLDDAGQLAFGASVSGARTAESDALVLDPARVHECVLRGWATNDPSNRRVELRVDGTIVWTREIAWPVANIIPVIGRNLTAEPGCANAFSGRIESAQRAPDGRDPLMTAAGDVMKVRVRFPVVRKGAREPLVVTGRTGAGDLLMVEYVDEHTIRFAVDHWGGPMLVSEPVSVDFTLAHDLTVATTALWGATSDIPLRMTRKGALRVELDGALVWRTPAPSFAVRPDEIAIGVNPIGGTSCSAGFSGDILSAERVAR